jgi:dihydrofolate reductase
MGKLISFMHVSLDGMIARTNGSMNWVQIGEEMFDYAEERTKHSNTALYGRGTFNIMDAYWPTAADSPDASHHDRQHSAWYKKVRKIVVSKTLKDPNQKNLEIIRDNVFPAIADLKKTVEDEIMMFGSPRLTSSLMQENLIDEYWLMVNPIILGEGISLFSGNKNEVKLKLEKSIAFQGGVVCLHYTKV